MQSKKIWMTTMKSDVDKVEQLKLDGPWWKRWPKKNETCSVNLKKVSGDSHRTIGDITHNEATSPAADDTRRGTNE